ncbi:MAG: ATP-binding cassette domain-containing protein [Oscillospiraceae bacterium]
MLYLSKFYFPSVNDEERFLFSIAETCYTSFYPFGILTRHSLNMLEFGDITLLYGGNGCGKTTVLNIIAETLNLKRSALYNRSDFFEDYISCCDYEIQKSIPLESRIITSDDVFDYMLDVRSINDHIDIKRDELFDEYYENKYLKKSFQLKSIDDLEELKMINEARNKSTSKSKYTKRRLTNNIKEYSNGESAFIYFSDKIKENALYL